MTRAIWLSPGDVRLTDEEALPHERRRFTGAMLVSALGHALVLALLIGLWAPAPEEIHAPIPITLRAGDGAAGAAGSGNSTVAASAASAASENPSPQQSTEAQTAPAETSAPQSERAPTVAPPTQALASAAEPPPPPAETAEPIPLRKPTPPRSPQPIAAQTPFPPAQAVSPPAPAGPATPAPSATATAMAGSDAVTNEGAGGRGRGDEGAGRAAIGNGSPEGLGDDYLEKVRRWVARYQKFPDEAAQKKQYGTAFVRIEIDPAGNVLDAEIEQSSGYPLLDEATLKMVHDASPLPKVPSTFKGNRLKIAIPANFKPGFFERLLH